MQAENIKHSYAKYSSPRTPPTVSSFGEMHSVDCRRTTEIDRPPWIGVRIRMRTTRYIAENRIRLMNTVVGQIGWKDAVSWVIVHAALISRSVQCCVVRQL